MDDSSKDRYDMILGTYILIELGLNLKFSEHIIESYDWICKQSTAPRVHLVTCIFKLSNIGEIKPS